ISGLVEYCTDLFSGQSISRLMAHFTQLLLSLVQTPGEGVGKIKMLSEQEEQQLLKGFNDTSTPYPFDKTVVELFEEQVAKTPNAVALVMDNQHLTYQQLNEKSNQLAHYLKEKEVRPGTNVALLSHRSLEMIIGIFGILKAGGAYVPMNIAYPPDRLKYIINDAGVMHVVYTDTSLLSSSGLTEYVCINVKESFTNSIQPLNIKAAPDARIYLMYTSGTTGRPKGIAVSNRNVTKLVYEPGVIAVHSTDKMLQWSNYAFDGSVYEIYCSLLKGASLHLIKDDWASDVHELSKVIKDQNLTVCFLTTALFNTFVDINLAAFQGLRKVLFGGEKVSPAHVQKALSAVGTGKIVHVYGPTETTVYATYYPVNSIGEDGLIPIGKPLANTKLLVLNKDQQLLPVGVPGELYIGGEGVSLGYLNRPELTREKFIQDPFHPGGRLYRTGDLGHWLPNGNIEYLGRMDNQVKIRGYRIEPGEIEDVLLQSELVSQAIVLVKEDEGGHKHLVGYIVSKAASQFNKEAVIAFLMNRLPEYMVPMQWVALESLPLNANGKVDKGALPNADLSANLSQAFVAPGTETEQALADIWKERLHLDQVGVHDNFFELGGHSLIIVQILDRVRRLGYEMTAKDFFTYQTIAQQSKFITTSLMLSNAPREKKSIIPVHSGRSTNIPLFSLPDYLIYCKLAKYINEDQPFYSAERSDHLSEIEAAAYHINEIKTVYPNGPYCLVGFCRWAGIALEMAHQLRARGEEVPLLILIEYYPNGSRLSKTSMRYISIGIRRFYKDFTESPTVMGKAKFVFSHLHLFRRFISKKLKKKLNNTPVFSGAPLKPYSGKVVIMSAKEAFMGFKKPSEMNWGERFTGDVESFYIDGDHLGVFFNEGSAQLGEKINALMKQVNKNYQAKARIVEHALAIENHSLF
ncbi:MAG TPA: amino acid adenylation domain-containing protein, partial [Flavisolibacter sp.]|nr:amino acid adenylation domain-containing protein [Flavisolibacter sp.]